MRNIGDRINEFDNSLTKTVGRFNVIFKECPLVGYKDSDEGEIGEITKSACIRLLQVAEFDVEHNFQRLLTSEIVVEAKHEKITNDVTGTNGTDDDWLWYFV